MNVMWERLFLPAVLHYFPSSAGEAHLCCWQSTGHFSFQRAIFWQIISQNSLLLIMELDADQKCSVPAWLSMQNVFQTGGSVSGQRKAEAEEHIPGHRSGTCRRGGKKPGWGREGGGQVAGGDAGRCVDLDVDDSEVNSGGEPRQIRLTHVFLIPT